MNARPVIIALFFTLSITVTTSDNYSLNRERRHILSRLIWCEWSVPSACSITCEGTGIRIRNRICSCYSNNPYKNIKMIFDKKCKKKSVQQLQTSCSTKNVTCPPPPVSKNRVYWILGGVVLALVTGCMIAWCLVGWLQGRKYDRQMSNSREHHESRRQPSVEGGGVDARRRHERVQSSTPTKPRTAPPPPYDVVMHESSGPSNDNPQAETQPQQEVPPPSYTEAIDSQMSQLPDNVV